MSATRTFAPALERAELDTRMDHDHKSRRARKLRNRAGRAVEHKADVEADLEDALRALDLRRDVGAPYAELAAVAGRVERYARMLDAAAAWPMAEADKSRAYAAWRDARNALERHRGLPTGDR